jgi:pimeloyl-ACP methyl ester carboxylesterase
MKGGAIMEFIDDELLKFESEGALPLPTAANEGYVENDGAQIWYSTYGAGIPIVLLHGGLGNSGNWGYQVSELIKHDYLTILIDSRGHGRSTCDNRPYTYKRMVSDLLAVLNHLQIDKAGLIGWSDGAVIALIFAHRYPDRTKGVFFFGCNMDQDGAKEFELTPIVSRCFNRHRTDYMQLSKTPDQFDAFVEAVGMMQSTEPNYTAQDLASIQVPVTVVHSQYDEFIKLEHAKYLAQTIPGADFVYLEGVSHFAPLQRPQLFNQIMLQFLKR